MQCKFYINSKKVLQVDKKRVNQFRPIYIYFFFENDESLNVSTMSNK